MNILCEIDPIYQDYMVNGEQLTICWHVDNLKSSHIDPNINDKFLQWIKDTFGQLGEDKMTQGLLHNYLGMTINYSVTGQVSIDMSHYVKKMVKEFHQENLNGASVASPWNENHFRVQHNSVPLEKKQGELFHTVTAQGLFLCKCGHPDIAPAITYGYNNKITQIGPSYVKCCNFSSEL